MPVEFRVLIQRFPAYRDIIFAVSVLSSSLLPFRFKRRTALRTELQPLRIYRLTIGAYDHRFRFRRFFVGFSLFFSLFFLFRFFLSGRLFVYTVSFLIRSISACACSIALIMAGCVVTEFLDFRINGFLISEFYSKTLRFFQILSHRTFSVAILAFSFVISIASFVLSPIFLAIFPILSNKSILSIPPFQHSMRRFGEITRDFRNTLERLRIFFYEKEPLSKMGTGSFV